MRRIFNLIRHPLFSGSAIMVMGSTIANALNYFYHLVIGRMLGPANYGELATLISLINLLGVIPVSISLGVVKYVSSSTEEERGELISWLNKIILRLSFLIFIFLLIGIPVISAFLHLTDIKYALAIAVLFLFFFPTVIYRAVLQGLLKFKESMTSIIFEICIKFTAGVLLIYLGYNTGGAILGFLVAAIFSLIQTRIYLKKYLKEKFARPSNYRSILLYTVPVVAQSMAMLSLISSDLILVKHFFSAHDTGIYAALSVLGKIIFFGAGPIGTVMFPLIAQRSSKDMKYEKILFVSLWATMLIIILVLMLYWLFPAFAIRLLYGQSYLEAYKLLIWFGIFIGLHTLSSLIINFHLSLGRTKIVLLPIVVAILQVLLIWLYHENLFTVIVISILVNALLLACLIIYSSYKKNLFGNEKFFFSRFKLNINNSSCI